MNSYSETFYYFDTYYAETPLPNKTTQTINMSTQKYAQKCNNSYDKKHSHHLRTDDSMF